MSKLSEPGSFFSTTVTVILGTGTGKTLLYLPQCPQVFVSSLEKKMPLFH